MLSTITLVACFLMQTAPTAPPPTSLSAELESFRIEWLTEDPEKQRSAEIRLRKFFEKHKPTADERRAVYMAAPALPPHKETYRDPQWDLVCAVRDTITEEDIPTIREVYTQLGRNAKAACIVSLTTLKTSRAATRAVVDLTLLFTKEPDLGYFNLGTFHHTPRHFDILFPALHKMADCDVTAFEYFALQLDWRHQQLPLKLLAEVFETTIRTHNRLIPRLRHLESLAPEELKGLPPDAAHGIEGEVLDLLGCFPSRLSVKALREAMALKGAELRLWAAASLLELKEPVAAADLEPIATDMNFRFQLLSVLAEKGAVDKYPKTYRTNAHIAEARFWDWLRSPMELGEPPHKLEVGKTVVLTDSEGEAVEYFVFKFLPKTKPDEPARNWEMGVSGPYRVKGGFDPHGGSETFSDFHAWDETLAEKEVERIRKRVEESRKRWEEMKTKP